MSIVAVEARIKELTQQLEQSLVNHNFIAGALSEARAVYSMLSAASLVPEKVANVVDAVAEAIPAIEEVAIALSEL